jgi:hypothetical protein
MIIHSRPGLGVTEGSLETFCDNTKGFEYAVLPQNWLKKSLVKNKEKDRLWD